MKVLIVDDDRLFVDKIKSTLEWEKLGVDKVYTSYDVSGAKEILNRYSVQLLMADVEMPGDNGLELLRWIQEKNLACKCIVISSHASFSYAQEAIRLQSSQYLLKPVSKEELTDAVIRVLGAIRVKEEQGTLDQDKQKEQFWKKYM